MQIKEEDYWDLLDEIVDATQRFASRWQQTVWAYMWMATFVSGGDDSYPPIDSVTENLAAEITESCERLSKELKSIDQSYILKLTDNGKSEFSIKWEDDEEKEKPTLNDEPF